MIKKSHDIRGAGLLELMLVMVIGALIIIVGIKQYQGFNRNTHITQMTEEANMLLSATKDYYRQNCVNQLLGPNAAAQLTQAQSNLTATVGTPQSLPLSTLFPGSSQVITNYFYNGSNEDAIFSAYLSVTPVQTNYVNRFNQTLLWQANASACISSSYLNVDANVLKGMFQASNAQTGVADCNGTLLTWTDLPRYTHRDYSSNLSLMKAELTQYTRQYQFGYWMKDNMNTLNLTQQDFNYLCQL